MAITNNEKNKRSSKKMYDLFDSTLTDIFSDEEFTAEVVKDWAKADPKGFMQLFGSRLPKVQPIDQDLQRTFISLKSMMMDLPEVEDVAKALQLEKGKNNKLQYELDTARAEIKMIRKKFIKK